MSKLSEKRVDPPIYGEDTVFPSLFYGSRLFVKIFLGLWAALVLTAAIVAVYTYIYHFEPETRRLYLLGKDILEENAQMVVDAYEKDGFEQAKSVSFPGNYWFLDDKLDNIFACCGKELTSSKSHKYRLLKREEIIHKAGDKAVALATRLFKGQLPDSEEFNGELLIGSLQKGESGKFYVLISYIPSKLLRQQRILTAQLKKTLPLFLLVTAVLCFILARYMTRPILELRKASRRFAGGIFTARVESGIEEHFDEIGDLARDFNEMAVKIENLINGQARLFGDISHELRTPLARLQICVELMQKKASDTDQQMLKRIEKEVGQMNKLIEQVLQLAKLEHDCIAPVKSEVDLARLLQKVCADVEFEGEVRSVQIDLEAPDSLLINASSELLGRALENILRNALCFSPDNSSIKVKLAKEQQGIVIAVKDQGPGVPEDQLSSIFNPFYRVEEDRDRQTGGAGLGLTIAQRAVHMHNGTIRLQNIQPSGLQVIINL